MPLQDLTPQLRTRLSRMERSVGWFVVLATVLLLAGFGYYVRNTAQRKGWFKTRVPYFTLIDRATGLHVGDPVLLMGFEVGQITQVVPQPPDDFKYNVYIEFEIKEPNYGYLWTIGSGVKVVSADFLGKRGLEVTKGTGGHATYVFNPLREMTLAEAEKLFEPEKWALAADHYDGTSTNLVIPALTPLGKETFANLHQLGVGKLTVLDQHQQRKRPTAVWNDQDGGYVKFIPKSDPAAKVKANLYWLFAEEAPAATERLETILSQVEKALPNVLNLTNQIAGVLAQSTQLTSNLNVVALNAQPASANLAALSAQLRAPGALGEWMLGTNGLKRTEAVLESAEAAITHADTNLTALAENLARSLENLAGITSNLNAQVQANTNILSTISTAVVDVDNLVQGLKRHWLLRSAFKSKTTNAPPVQRLTSPRDPGQR